MAVEIVRASDDDVWHRTDILGCSRTSTLRLTDSAETREVTVDEVPEERCTHCSW